MIISALCEMCFYCGTHLLLCYCTLRQQSRESIDRAPPEHEQNVGLLRQFLTPSNKSLPAKKRREKGNENIMCLAFIHTIIASHVEEGNMKCSSNSWVAVFFARVLNIFMIRPQDANLPLSDSLYPLCLVPSGAEADHFCLTGGGGGEPGVTQPRPPAEQREQVEQEERLASR